MICKAFQSASRQRLSSSSCVVLLETHISPCMTGFLAEKAGVSTAAMTGIIDRLEARGFVTRCRGVSDRRKIFIEITPAGDEAVARINQEGGADEREHD